MIIPNGTIQPRVKAAAGLDPATGYPLRPTSQGWGASVPCQYTFTAFDATARTPQGEAAQKQGYNVLVDANDLSDTPVRQVRLCDLHGRELGTFTVRMTTYLRAVHQVQLTL